MAEAFPVGDMHPPNKVLQLEWFYMSFHKEDRAKYVESSQHLSNEKLEFVAEYFENIFNLQVADGSLANKHKRQIKQRMRRKINHKLGKQFHEKVCRVTERRHGGDNCHSRQGNKYYCHNYKWQDCDDSGRCDNYNKCNRKQENKTPFDCGDKAFKPCLVHGPKSKHTSKECHKNPKNDKRQDEDKKRQYKAHHNDAHYTSDNGELRISIDTPVPSEDPESASSESEKTHEDENYHLHIDKKMKAGRHVPCKSDHQQHGTRAQSSQKGKKGKMPPIFLDDDLDFMDTVLMGLDSINTDLDRPDDITNAFDFYK